MNTASALTLLLVAFACAGVQAQPICANQCRCGTRASCNSQPKCCWSGPALGCLFKTRNQCPGLCPANRPRFCDNKCVNPKTDSLNCGVCGRACGGGVCVNGVCKCVPGFSKCSNICVNLRNNKDFCGNCSTKCTGGKVCSAGICKCPTASPNTCSNTCVNLLTNKNFCGNCTTKCPSNQICRAGICGCPTGLTNCAGTCVNITSSFKNCGACGTTCRLGESCVPTPLPVAAGAAPATCQCSGPGKKVCPVAGITQCINVNGTLAGNCGDCGKVCDAGKSCVAGTCVCPPPTPDYCPGFGRCVNFQTNERFCGNCTISCPGQVCKLGKCGPK